MKTAALLLVGCLSGTALAQTQSPINQQVISSPPGYAAPGQGSLAITNQSGQSLSLTELDAQLATLKSDVERTLPMLSVVTGQANAATGTRAPSRSQAWVGAASNLLANAFGRNPNANASVPPGETSPRFTNFTSFLRSLVSTNAGGAGGVSLDPNTVSQLATLQNDLKPVLSILDTLNVNSFASGTNLPPGSGAPPLTPTGR